MTTRLLSAALLNSILVLSVCAADDADINSPMFREWIYPESHVVERGATEALPSGEPVAESGQFNSRDSMQQVLDFYAKKSGLDPTALPVKLRFADGKPALDAKIIGVRANDDAPSVMLLRNAGENASAVTLLWWSPADRQKIVASITRGKDDSRTHIQLMLHRRE